MDQGGAFLLLGEVIIAVSCVDSHIRSHVSHVLNSTYNTISGLSFDMVYFSDDAPVYVLWTTGPKTICFAQQRHGLKEQHEPCAFQQPSTAPEEV